MGLSAEKLKGSFYSGNCSIRLDTSNPYVIINVENLCKAHSITSSSHVDLLVIELNNDNFDIYLIELKSVKEGSSDDILKMIIEAKNNKFPQTEKLLEQIGNKQIGIKQMLAPSPRATKIYRVIALPENVINELSDKIRALLKHMKFNLQITSCDYHYKSRRL